MNKILLLIFSIMTITSYAQENVDILLLNGHVIDPSEKIDKIENIAIKDGKIYSIGQQIGDLNPNKIINLSGLIVTPGLIDIHTHFFWGSQMDQSYMNGPNAIQPDGFTFRNGITTAVDAGSSGWKSFRTFKKQTIDNAQTRILAFLNIVGEGMRGGHYEQDTMDMDIDKAAAIAATYPSDIIGFKVAHYDGPSWCPVDHAVAASRKIGDTLPIMVDFGGSKPALSIQSLFFDHLRSGDIFTHCYAELGAERESIVDLSTNKVKPFVWKARQKGIVFDVGYGGISFAYSQAIPSMQQHFYPNSISTDIHRESMNAAMKDILTTMDKFLAMGMPLQDVIAASTINPAKEIRRLDLGSLKVGSCADIAVFQIEKGHFGLFDYKGIKLETDKKLVCEMTLRNGRIVYDLNGLEYPSK